MKRFWIIFSFFAAGFSLFCMPACTFHTDESFTAMGKTCHGFFCYRDTEEETLEGCHVKDECSCSPLCDQVEVDCYWFPTAFGCYGNEFTSFHEGCMPPSCVVFGADLTLWECYGDGWKEPGSDVDTRMVGSAMEGIDYKIDNIIVAVDDYVGELGLGIGEIGDTISTLIGLINMRDAVDLRFYVEYTAYTELHSVVFSTDIIYDDSMSWVSGFSEGILLKAGNTDEDGYSLKSKNIQPGKHILSGKVSLDMYELLSLEDITNVSFDARTYYEVEE